MGKREADILISPKFLEQNCTLSLKERAHFIKQQFPSSAISASAIQRLYKQKNIKFKKVHQKRCTYDEQKLTGFKAKHFDLIEQLIATDDENEREIFQIDETVFIGADHMRRAWAATNNNLTLQLAGKQEQQSSKVIGAISNKGTYFYYASPNYFNANDVVKFLKLIKGKMRTKPWALFWDNCPTHRSLVVKDFLEQHNIPVVCNIAYMPEFNGIESLWSSQK